MQIQEQRNGNLLITGMDKEMSAFMKDMIINLLEVQDDNPECSE